MGYALPSELKIYRWMRQKGVDLPHIFIQFASELQCYTEVISVAPQDISVKATHRAYVYAITSEFEFFQL